MKKLHEDTLAFPTLAYHIGTDKTLWKVTGFRSSGNRNVNIICMKDNLEEGYKAGEETWCDVRNLYLAPEQLDKNIDAKLLLEEEY